MTQHPPERLPLDLSREVPLNGANPIEYVLASTADEHKRQRDDLCDWLRLAIAHVEENLTDEHGFLSGRSKGLVSKMRAAIAECEGDEK